MPKQEAIERVQTPELLQAEIQTVYDRVFSDKDSFNGYFFATSDRNPHDLQIRLGVFTKRLLEEPNERFWLMRRHYANTEFPETSIHRLDRTGGFNQALALNGYTQAQLDAWREEQPSEMEQFLQMVESMVRAKLQLPAPDGDGQPKTIYQYPSFSLSEEAVNEVLQAVIPADTEVNMNQYSRGDKHFDINTPSIGFSVHVWNHDIFGDYIGITFRDEAVQIDDCIREEYARYYEAEVLPTLVKNAIQSMDPQTVSKSISEGVNSGTVFERMYLTPGALHYANEGKKSDKKQYYAWGSCLDIDFKYAQKLDLLPPEMRWMDFTFPGGWFLTTEQLWHSLFNSPYPGEVVISEPDTTSTAIQVRSNEASPTHQMIFANIAGNDHEQQEFATRAQSVIEGYRPYTVDDQEVFTFPENYQPIAVSRQGDFAIGFVEREDGVELCFQVPDEVVVSQINKLEANNREAIERLQQKNADLDNLRNSYRR